MRASAAVVALAVIQTPALAKGDSQCMKDTVDGSERLSVPQRGIRSVFNSDWHATFRRHLSSAGSMTHRRKGPARPTRSGMLNAGSAETPLAVGKGGSVGPEAGFL
jgi:hypothetical protein